MIDRDFVASLGTILLNILIPRLKNQQDSTNMDCLNYLDATYIKTWDRIHRSRFILKKDVNIYTQCLAMYEMLRIIVW